MAEKNYFHTDTNGYVIEPVSIGKTRVILAKAEVNYNPVSDDSNVIITGQLRPENAKNPSIRHIFSYTSHFKYRIEHVIISGPMTIVFWNDDTKTRVRLAEGSFDDRATAIRWAMAKKYYGSRAQLEKRLGASRKFGDMWDDNTGVYTILMTLFGDPKKLEEYVNDALKIAEDYNKK